VHQSVLADEVMLLHHEQKCRPFQLLSGLARETGKLAGMSDSSAQLAPHQADWAGEKIGLHRPVTAPAPDRGIYNGCGASPLRRTSSRAGDVANPLEMAGRGFPGRALALSPSALVRVSSAVSSGRR